MVDPRTQADIDKIVHERELGRLRGITYRADPQNREKARLRCVQYRADPEKRELECLKRKERIANETPEQNEKRLKENRERMGRLRRVRAVAVALRIAKEEIVEEEYFEVDDGVKFCRGVIPLDTRLQPKNFLKTYKQFYVVIIVLNESNYLLL